MLIYMLNIYKLITYLAFCLCLISNLHECSHKVMGARKFFFASIFFAIQDSYFFVGSEMEHWFPQLQLAYLFYPAFKILHSGLCCCYNICSLAFLFIIKVYIKYFLLHIYIDSYYLSCLLGEKFIGIKN